MRNTNQLLLISYSEVGDRSPELRRLDRPSLEPLGGGAMPTSRFHQVRPLSDPVLIAPPSLS